MTPNTNVNVNIDTESSVYVDTFYPDDGYALWEDNEEGNIDENGEPMQYYFQKNVVKLHSESVAPHIFAKLIDDTMEIIGNPNPGVSTFGLRAPSGEEGEVSHTYIDENGVERRKRGVY